MKQRKPQRASKPPQPSKAVADTKPPTSRNWLVILALLLAFCGCCILALTLLFDEKPTMPTRPKFKTFSPTLQLKTPPPIYKDDLFQILENKEDFDQKCSRDFPTPAVGNGSVKQRCCEFRERGKYQCLPNIVVLGAQKAGTTALISYFLLLPRLIEFAGSKELHFFDSDATFAHLRDQIYQMFSLRTREHIAGKMIAESSPSYLADYKACPRMARVLSEDARYIILLRNPVHRTWSDFQMKHRRIFFQTEFLHEIIPEFHADFARAFRTCNFACNYFEFMALLPERASKHGRLVYLYRWVMSRQPLVHRFLKECLVSRSAALHCTKGEFARKFVDEVMPPLPDSIYNEARALNRSLTCCLDEEKSYRCGKKCFPRDGMMADVSRNHLWRSMYLPQLIHCFGSLRHESVLIIDNERLRHDTQAVLTEVFAHLRLPVNGSEVEEISRASKERLDQALSARFPDFEAVNGWKRTPEMDLQLSPELREYLEDFFRPHNRALFEYLGVEPYKGWAV